MTDVMHKQPREQPREQRRRDEYDAQAAMRQKIRRDRSDDATEVERMGRAGDEEEGEDGHGDGGMTRAKRR